MDLLRFQSLSNHIDDVIDVGVYIIPTEGFINMMKGRYNKKWIDSVSFERWRSILSMVQESITVPMFLIGITLAEIDGL